MFDCGIADFIATPAESWTADMLLHVQRNLSLSQLEVKIKDAKILYSSKKDENLANDYQKAIVKTAAFCLNAKKNNMPQGSTSRTCWSAAERIMPIFSKGPAQCSQTTASTVLRS